MIYMKIQSHISLEITQFNLIIIIITNTYIDAFHTLLL